jgi:hypothetical protein
MSRTFTFTLTVTVDEDQEAYDDPEWLADAVGAHSRTSTAFGAFTPTSRRSRIQGPSAVDGKASSTNTPRYRSTVTPARDARSLTCE